MCSQEWDDIERTHDARVTLKSDSALCISCLWSLEALMKFEGTAAAPLQVFSTVVSRLATALREDR